MDSGQALSMLWRAAGLPSCALKSVSLTGTDPVVPSSFALGAAAQSSIAAAALTATQIGLHRNGVEQTLSVELLEAALECFCRFTVNGRTPELWDKLAGAYPCASGGNAGAWVRVHTNFAHHRDGLLRLLGLPEGPDTAREQVAQALLSWDAFTLEETAAQHGVLVAACRTADEWQAHPQRAALAERDVVDIEKIGDAPPLEWPELASSARPLSGLRVLELTRILAGPVAGRTLAAYGADVMLVNSPHLPNIDAIIDTSRGKLSALADLRQDQDRAAFDAVISQAHVFMQGYRPGALAALGHSAEAVAQRRPGIVVVSLSAYGETGPWAFRRGFDSLVQTACGLNHQEAQAANSNKPQALPMQILDMASGFLMAFGAQAALLRQQREGGSWHVRVSLARTAQWLRELGRVDAGLKAPAPDFSGLMETSNSGYGELTASRHAARFSHTPARWNRPSMPPGSHALSWPEH
jgi:crotonobetainyl-CoA:carnitine CoA-transferase CaiB-like acyl-CoA transferase